MTFSDDTQVSRWSRLEELLVASGEAPPPVFRPTIQCFTNATDNRSNPITFVGGICQTIFFNFKRVLFLLYHLMHIHMHYHPFILFIYV